MRGNSILLALFWAASLYLAIRMSGDLGYVRGREYDDSFPKIPTFYTATCYWLGQETERLDKSIKSIQLKRTTSTRCTGYPKN